jgi:hypothetical protein
VVGRLVGWVFRCIPCGKELSLPCLVVSICGRAPCAPRDTHPCGSEEIELSVTFNGEHIYGSPFYPTVLPAPTSSR